MLTIGDFSALAQVPVLSLQQYEQQGWLKPHCVDKETGRLFYSAAQLPRLHCLLALTDLGFGLEQIAPFLEEHMDAPELGEMLQRRQAEARRRWNDDQARLRQAAGRLALMESEKTPGHEIRVKHAEAIAVASLRASLPSLGALPRLFGELAIWANAAQAPVVGPAQAVWHLNEHRDGDIDVEALLPVAAGAAANRRIRVYVLPQAEMATTIHTGASALRGAHQALHLWAEQQGYQAAGPVREVYLHPDPLRPDDTTPPEEFVTEVQLPLLR